jgi:hypothetical protein
MLTVRSEIGPYQEPLRDFTEKPPTRPKRRPLGKRGSASQRFSFLGWHQDEARKNIDNYFFKVFAQRPNPASVPARVWACAQRLDKPYQNFELSSCLAFFQE